MANASPLLNQVARRRRSQYLWVLGSSLLTVVVAASLAGLALLGSSRPALATWTPAGTPFGWGYNGNGAEGLTFGFGGRWGKATSLA